MSRAFVAPGFLGHPEAVAGARGGRRRRCRSRRRRATWPRRLVALAGRCGSRSARPGRGVAIASATVAEAARRSRVHQVGGLSSISPSSRWQGVGRAHPRVLVDLADVDGDVAGGGRGQEEPGGEALDGHRWRRPVGEGHQRASRSTTRSASSAASRGRGGGGGCGLDVALGTRRRGSVVVVDPTTGEHPVPAGEGQLGVAAQHQGLEAVAGIADEDHRGRGHRVGHLPLTSRSKVPPSRHPVGGGSGRSVVTPGTG